MGFRLAIKSQLKMPRAAPANVPAHFLKYVMDLVLSLMKAESAAEKAQEKAQQAESAAEKAQEKSGGMTATTVGIIICIFAYVVFAGGYLYCDLVRPNSWKELGEKVRTGEDPYLERWTYTFGAFLLLPLIMGMIPIIVSIYGVIDPVKKIGSITTTCKHWMQAVDWSGRCVICVLLISALAMLYM